MGKISIYVFICICLSNQIQTTTDASKLLNTQISSLIAVEVPLTSQELNLTCNSHEKLTTTIYTLNFTCNVYLCGNPASSIHELKPSDVSIVAALGDSQSVGLFAKNSKLDICLVHSLPEYRGVSWSIGGDLDLGSVLTLPNILKLYNPKLKGYSTGIGSHLDQNSQLNMAISGAVTIDLPFQATRLVDKLRGDRNIDIDNEWKLVTIFIGGNDLCIGCIEVERFSALRFYQHLKTTIDILSTLPRTFVNIAQVPDVYELTYLNTEYCRVMQALFKVIGKCPCMYSSSTQGLIKEYTEILQELVREYQEIEREDFTVVIQPFFKEIKLREVEDLPSYFSGDCFHFSQKTHALNALLLWNNMLQPVGEKYNYLNSNTGIICPTEGQYFYTFRNSQTKGKSVLRMTIAVIAIVLIISTGSVSLFVLLFRGWRVKYESLN